MVTEVSLAKMVERPFRKAVSWATAILGLVCLSFCYTITVAEQSALATQTGVGVGGPVFNYDPKLAHAKALGVFPYNPLATVRGLPAVHEPLLGTGNSNRNRNGNSVVFAHNNAREQRLARGTGTAQGCNLNKVSVSLRQDSLDDLERTIGSLPEAKAAAADVQLRVATHITFFTGVADLQYCAEQEPDHAGSDFDRYSNANPNPMLPDWHTGCLFEESTVAVMKVPQNLPVRPVEAQVGRCY